MPRTFLFPRSTRVLMCLLSWVLTASAAEVIEITEDNWRSITPDGKEADWILGDYVLRNDKLVAVIAKPIQTRNANMTVRNVGGAVIDLTFRHRQNDQLSCFYPGAAELPMRYLNWQIDDVGASVTIASDWRDGKPNMEVQYRLNNGESFITVKSVFSNPHSTQIEFPLRDAVRADRGFQHSLEEALFVTHDYWWRQAYGILPESHRLEAVADSLDRGRPIIGYVGELGSTIKLGPGESHELQRKLIPGEHALQVRSQVDAIGGERLSTLAVVVVDDAGFVPNAEVSVTMGDQRIGRAVAPEAGPLTLQLKPGEYQLTATGQGRGSQTITAQLETDRLVSTINLPSPGVVVGRVRDDAGQPIPAKIQFRGTNVPDPDFGPDTKSFGVRNLQYTALGEFEAELAPGEYEVIVSRGTEYDADFQTLTVERGKVTELNAALTRSVDTTGWVSSDFHSHSTPSGDNTSDQLGRVLNLLAEHIEFAPCTEHNRISSYTPHLQFLKAESRMATCTGMELTGGPLPINHQNAFPLYHKPRTQDGGGPTTDGNPSIQIERLAMWDDGSDKLVQENHPNLEQIWADRDLDGNEDPGFKTMFGFMDVIEVHPPADVFTAPGTKTGQYRNVIQSWLRMLNSGYRIPGVVNTDAHYNFHGSGWLRNYIKSSTDQPAEIDTMEMVRQSEQGHVVMTNGPYLEVTARAGEETAIPGDDLRATAKRVSLDVRVQCPNWFDVNRVQLVLNGRLSANHEFTRRANPTMFGNGVVKFEQTIEVDLESDTHVIVATIGDGLKLGPVMGPQEGEVAPAALTNPIFVDVDGGGFQPNGDLLDLPFPYKAE